MIGPIDRNLNIPAVEEKLGVNPSGGVSPSGGTVIDVPAAGTTVVIANVPCIHAREIVVMLTAGPAKIDHVYLDIYAGSRTQVVPVDLGHVNANTTALFQYLGGAGQTYDVRVDPQAVTTVEVWTCARA